MQASESEILDLEKRIYPIGRFAPPTQVTTEMRHEFIRRIETLPKRLFDLASTLNEEELAASYRENGWTARQIIHHMADSHVNAYIRFKLALTEENPTITPYNENAWSQFDEAKNGALEPSLSILTHLHVRWIAVLKSASDEDFLRSYYHPQYKTKTTLNDALALYAWHGDHHLGQVNVIHENYIPGVK